MEQVASSALLQPNIISEARALLLSNEIPASVQYITEGGPMATIGAVGLHHSETDSDGEHEGEGNAGVRSHALPGMLHMRPALAVQRAAAPAQIRPAAS